MILAILDMLLYRRQGSAAGAGEFLQRTGENPPAGTGSGDACQVLCPKPRGGIGKIAGLLAMYKANQPYASWDWKRMQEVAEYTVPLVDLTRKADPEASISAQLDALTERDAVIAIRPGKYSEWDVFQEQMPEFLKILSDADSMAIFPLLEERLEAVLVFLGPENG